MYHQVIDKAMHSHFADQAQYADSQVIYNNSSWISQSQPIKQIAKSAFLILIIHR